VALGGGVVEYHGICCCHIFTGHTLCAGPDSFWHRLTARGGKTGLIMKKEELIGLLSTQYFLIDMRLSLPSRT